MSSINGQFTCFLGLPLELQDKVWQLAIPSPVRTAFHAKLTRQAKHTDEDGSYDPSISRDRVHLDHAPFAVSTGTADRGDVIFQMSNLLTACWRSHDIAVHAYQSITPKSPFHLRRQHSIYRGFPIDAMSDLAILGPGWQAPCRLIGQASMTRTKPPTPLRYLGLLWPGPSKAGQSSFYHATALDGLLGLWGQGLRALYVVVDPKDLVGAERSWSTDDGAVDIFNFLHMRPVDYVSWYKADDTEECQVFKCGQREYYEMDLDTLAKLGGIEEAVELLEAARIQMTANHGIWGDGELVDIVGDKPGEVRCRVMTWRVPEAPS